MTTSDVMAYKDIVINTTKGWLSEDMQVIVAIGIAIALVIAASCWGASKVIKAWK